MHNSICFQLVFFFPFPHCLILQCPRCLRTLSGASTSDCVVTAKHCSTVAYCYSVDCTAQHSPVLSDRYEPILCTRFLSILGLVASRSLSVPSSVVGYTANRAARQGNNIKKNKLLVRGNARTYASTRHLTPVYNDTKY